MRWRPHQPVAIDTKDDTVIIRARASGPVSLTRHGFLRLPAAIRHRQGIRGDDPLIVAAYPHREIILIRSVSVLDELFDRIVEGHT